MTPTGSGGSTTTTIFVYDLDGQLLGEYDGQGKPIREYAWLKHIPVAMWAADPANPSGAPLVYFIHTDHLNTPRVVVDRNGKTRWRWLAEPFGTTAPETNPSGLGDFTQNLRMPGQYADAESGLWYNYSRSYDSTTGRYSQSDSVGLAGGSASTYTYVDGNPLVFVDPLGLWSIAYEIYPAGEGGGVIFGKDPITQQFFISLRYGIGVGGGLDIDPFGGRPGARKSCYSGFSVGGFAKVGGRIGPIKEGMGANFGFTTDQPHWYGSFGSLKGSATNRLGWGVNESGAVGAEVTVFSSPMEQTADCLCSK